MDEVKWVLQSRTVISAILAIMGLANALAANLGVALPAWMLHINQVNADLIVAIIGAAATIYFRTIATKQLVLTPTPVPPAT